MIDGHITRGHSETTALIDWFQSGDQNGSRVRNASSLLSSLILHLVGRMMGKEKSPRNKSYICTGKCGHVVIQREMMTEEQTRMKMSTQKRQYTLR